MLCEGMEVIANSLQDFGSWGRRASQLGVFLKVQSLNALQLVTIRKTSTSTYAPPSFEPSEADSNHVPAHKDFRDKYFQGFKKEDEANGRWSDVAAT